MIRTASSPFRQPMLLPSRSAESLQHPSTSPWVARILIRPPIKQLFGIPAPPPIALRPHYPPKATFRKLPGTIPARRVAPPPVARAPQPHRARNLRFFPESAVTAEGRATPPST